LFFQDVDRAFQQRLHLAIATLAVKLVGLPLERSRFGRWILGRGCDA